jgi:hypothetical protein
MFQAASDWTFTGNTIRTSAPRALITDDGNEFSPDLQAITGTMSGNNIIGCVAYGCSVVLNTGVVPKTVDLSNLFNGKFTGNNVIGNIFAYPANDITISDNVQDFTTTYATPTPAISLREFNNATIQSNRILASTLSGTPTVYLNADSTAATITVKGNSFTVPTDAANYGVQVVNSTLATGTFIYEGNTPLNQVPGGFYELVAPYPIALRSISYAFPTYSGISSLIGGTYAAGGCKYDSAVLLTGAAAGMVFAVSDATATPAGEGLTASAKYISANLVEVQVCASAGVTVADRRYGVRALQVNP